MAGKGSINDVQIGTLPKRRRTGPAAGFGQVFFFLIPEPNGLARLWAIGKEKLRLWPFPH
jgi:hypothetical protein